MSLRCLSPIVSQSFTTASFSYQQQHFQDTTCQIQPDFHNWFQTYSYQKHSPRSRLNAHFKLIRSSSFPKLSNDLSGEMDYPHPRKRKNQRFQDP